MESVRSAGGEVLQTLKGIALTLPIIAVGLGAATFWRKGDLADHFRAEAQTVIDQHIPGNRLAIDFMKTPMAWAVPFSMSLAQAGILPAEGSGYFTVKRKNGSTQSSACVTVTISYTLRLVRNELRFDVSPQETHKLLACQ